MALAQYTNDYDERFPFVRVGIGRPCWAPQQEPYYSWRLTRPANGAGWRARPVHFYQGDGAAWRWMAFKMSHKSV